MSAEEFTDDGELTYKGWRRALREGVLLGQRCADCDAVTATPKAACASCGRRNVAVEELPTEGTVHSVTTIGVAPAGLDGGYSVAVVDLGDARILGRLEEAAEIGESVSLSGIVELDGMPGPVFGVE